MVKKGIIFDCDGVLLDSMNMWNNILYEVLLSYGIDDKSINDICSDMTIEETSIYIKEKYNLEDSPINIRLKINCILESHYFFDLELKPGVKEFLSKACELGYKMIIASQTPKPLISACFKRLGILDYFIDIITTIKVKKSKQYPDIYDYCLRVLDLDKTDVYVFEDVYHALNTLINASYDCIGVYDINNEYIYDMDIKTIDSFLSIDAFDIIG